MANTVSSHASSRIRKSDYSIQINWSTQPANIKPPKTIAKQYTRLLALWPKDALRPHLPFTRAIEHRAIPYVVSPAEPTKSSSKSAAQPTPAKVPQATPQEEAAQINALFSLLENRYAKKYPLSPGVLKPASNPEYYDRLIAEIEAAPGKSWWALQWDQLKGKVRWR